MTKPGYYDHLTFNAPLSESRAESLVRSVARRQPRSVLDIGCGLGELLLRIAAAVPGCEAIGVDADETLVDRARHRAADLGTAGVRFDVADGKSVTEPADAVVCIGSDHVFGDQLAAVTALHSLVRPGGVLLFGTGYWRSPPTVEQAAGLGATIDELRSLGELVAMAVVRGFRPLEVQTAGEDEWNAFESGFLADWEEAIMTDPRSPQADEWRRSADAHRDGWLQGYRDVLGFAYLVLGVPG